MHLPKKLLLLLVSLAAIAAFAAGCGDDKKDSGASDAATTESTESTADDTATDDTATDEAASGEIDEATLRQFIKAINDDPTVICDPENATQELLDQVGGDQASCEEALADEPAGGKYTIDDLQIDGDTATATITDDDSTSKATFVQEGDELKISGSEDQPAE